MQQESIIILLIRIILLRPWGGGAGAGDGGGAAGPVQSRRQTFVTEKKKNEIKLPFSSLVPLLKTLTGQRVLTVPNLLHSMMDMPIARMPPHLRKSELKT